MWEAQDNNTVGVREGKGGRARYAFDTVFGHAATNKEASSIPITLAIFWRLPTGSASDCVGDAKR